MEQNRKPSESKIIGSFWNNSSTKGNNQSVAFTGKRPQDEFEVLLRHKASGGLLNLSTEANVVLYPVKEKKKENSPDGVIVVYFKE